MLLKPRNHTGFAYLATSYTKYKHTNENKTPWNMLLFAYA